MEERPSRDTIDGLQVLRAVAAMMVVTHHATHSVPGAKWVPFGGAGVDIFFVISGFVMAHTTAQLVGGRDDALRFLLKRVLRIVPLYWIAIIWATRRTPIDANLIRDLFFVPHYNTQAPEMLNPIVVQGWTLNYEMAFYALFSLCLLFPARLMIVLTTLVVMPFVGTLLPGAAGDFYKSMIVYEFGFGILLQTAISRWGLPAWPRITFLAFLISGFVLIALGFDLEPRPLTQGLPAALIVWSSIHACRGWMQLKLLRLLADASYAIYLFHWASFGAVKPLTRLIGPGWTDTLMVAHIAVALISGCIIHLTLEKPLLRVAQSALGNRTSRRLAHVVD